MLLRVFFLLIVILEMAAASGRKTVDRTVTVDGVTYRYIVSVPIDWTSDRTWPVILFLHGSVGRGSDGISQ